VKKALYLQDNETGQGRTEKKSTPIAFQKKGSTQIFPQGGKKVATPTGGGEQCGSWPIWKKTVKSAKKKVKSESSVHAWTKRKKREVHKGVAVTCK